MVIKALLNILTVILLGNYFPVLAGPPADTDIYQQATYYGTVDNVAPNDQSGQDVEVKITTGILKNQVVVVTTGLTLTENIIEYKKGDSVILTQVHDKIANQDTYYISDYNRTGSLYLLFFIFVVVVLVVSKKWGIYSIIGMFYSFFIISKYILPLLLKGLSPLFVAITGALLIAPVSFYLSHGLNRKTTVALISTIISLIITGVISIIFIGLSKLTGFSTDEAFFLQIAKSGTVNIKGIYLAGIIIGTLGILDDVTISQSAIVNQLRTTVRNISDWDLYKKAMEVGHDHIASTVNTLVLVYTGAALPLLLLFVNSSQSFTDAINAEIIADEIIRTLVGSIGLVLAVPISTLLAVFFARDVSKHK